MRIYLAGGFTVMLKEGRERELNNKFPEAKTTASCISWYRMDIKKGNKYKIY